MSPTTRSQTSATPLPDTQSLSSRAESNRSESISAATGTFEGPSRRPKGSRKSKAASPLPGWDTSPPVYTIDLSLPPEQRYLQVASDYKAMVSGLPMLFKELIGFTSMPFSLAKFITRIFLWRLYSKEETAEIRGIGKAVGVDMWLMVAFNVLLDCVMGCSSGGVQVREGDETKMMHYRTLDWAMDSLRKVVVQLDFVEHAGGDVIATSITYVGYVGVLTGVRYVWSAILY